MYFDYLTPATGPVVEGLQDYEKIYGLEQPQYLPIRALLGENGNSAIYRCELTPEQRRMIADGADILVELLHFGCAIAPSRVMLLGQRDINQDEFSQWFIAQAKVVHPDEI